MIQFVAIGLVIFTAPSFYSFFYHLTMFILTICLFNQTLSTLPTTIDVTLSEAVRVDSVNLTNLVLSGGAAVTGVEIVDGRTARFQVTVPDVDGIYTYTLPAVFKETFNNVLGNSQTYNLEPNSGGVNNLGFSSAVDSIYRAISIIFTATDSITNYFDST
ncbi:hypothetical protein LC653_38580 [Nostoc sp. CHAB 5784]|uniref:hypothetical protein n=1 Tax=Nostoc mirabile TaxID=2907820 RepID=UPI001E306819|nr:hypothetical protein [Nostoc mirabile]MCC5669573.1 hypothetical protein [Nostoc mirabile CHAB5784]